MRIRWWSWSPPGSSLVGWLFIQGVQYSFSVSTLFIMKNQNTQFSFYFVNHPVIQNERLYKLITLLLLTYLKKTIWSQKYHFIQLYAQGWQRDALENFTNLNLSDLTVIHFSLVYKWTCL